MATINFIFGGQEYAATFNRDGDCERIYSYREHRYLEDDGESGVRERPHVWTAAYTMLGD